MGHLIAMQRKKQMEEEHANHLKEESTFVIGKLHSGEYFKPKEFIRQATSYNSKPPAQRLKERTH